MIIYLIASFRNLASVVNISSISATNSSSSPLLGSHRISYVYFETAQSYHNYYLVKITKLLIFGVYYYVAFLAIIVLSACLLSLIAYAWRRSLLVENFIVYLLCSEREREIHTYIFYPSQRNSSFLLNILDIAIND